MHGNCGFMAANLYAKSIFGEDALANLSIEKPSAQGPEAPVIGHIRIRAKSQVNLAAEFTGTRKHRSSNPEKITLNVLPLLCRVWH